MVNPLWCKNHYPCTIEVFQNKKHNAIPLDRVIVESAQNNKAVFLTKGKNLIAIKNSSGKLLFEHKLGKL